VEDSALTLVLRACPSSTRRLLLASRREFEEASGSEFDVPTIACNNTALPIFDEQVNQEKQQLLNDFEKLLNDKGYLDSDYSQASEIQLCPENSALATISEQDLSKIAEISFPATLTQSSTGSENETNDSFCSSSLNLNQPSTIDNGDELAKLVAALDPSEALVSGNGWPDPREAAAHHQSASYEKPDSVLTPPYAYGSPDTMETATIYRGETSPNNNGVHSSVTLTLPVVTATSFEQPTGQLSGTTWPERVASFSMSQESSYINSNACSEVHKDASLTSRLIIEEAQTRPSVIVAARSRKRVSGEETNSKDAVLKLSDDDVSPSVLEKRRKGNERCKRYRKNKKQREAEEDAELEDLEARNSFLREEEQRLTARKRKLQQAYLGLIRQKKIRFS